MWTKIKQLWSDSGTILWARLESIGGLVTAAIGAMDWSPLLSLDFSTGFNRAQVITLGAIMFVRGILLEITRRRNAVDL